MERVANWSAKFKKALEQGDDKSLRKIKRRKLLDIIEKEYIKKFQEEINSVHLLKEEFDIFKIIELERKLDEEYDENMDVPEETWRSFVRQCIDSYRKKKELLADEANNFELEKTASKVWEDIKEIEFKFPEDFPEEFTKRFIGNLPIWLVSYWYKSGNSKGQVALYKAIIQGLEQRDASYAQKEGLGKAYNLIHGRLIQKDAPPLYDGYRRGWGPFE